jgi:Na+-translocating ferredoxin:NAD+ oxidoreductase RnfC subunit
VYAVELGTPVGEVLATAGGAVEAVRGLLIGGLGGSWLDAAAAAPVPLTHGTCGRPAAPWGSRR